MKALWKEENYKLENGLNITIIRKPGFHSYACYVAVPVGGLASSYKINGHKTPSGVAHFLEHRLFDTSLGEAFDLFTSLGCDANAYTTYQFTTYYFHTSTNLIEGIKVLLHMTNNLTFTKEAVENEKAIIIEEAHMRHDHPGSRLGSGLRKNLFINYPLNLDVIGLEEDINNTTLEDLKRVFNTYYSLDNLRMFLVGDIDQSIIDEISKIPLHKNEEKFELEYVLKEETEEVVNSEVTTIMDVPTPLIVTGIKKMNLIKEMNLDDATYEAIIEIANNMLFSDSEKLVKEMTKAHLVDSSITGGITRVGDVEYIEVQTSSSKISKIKEKFIHFFTHIDEYLNESSFERIKRYCIGSILYSIDGVKNLADLIIAYNMRGHNLLKILEALENIEYHQVEKYVKLWKGAIPVTHIIRKEK